LPSEVLLSPQDNDLFEYSFATNTRGYLNTGSRKFNHRKVHKIIAYRMGLNTSEENDLVIDHINRNVLDNRRENLRLVSRETNANNLNQLATIKGYHWYAKAKKYRATITLKGKKVRLGLFDDPAQARAAYVQAKNKHLTELGLTDLLFKE